MGWTLRYTILAVLAGPLVAVTPARAAQDSPAPVPHATWTDTSYEDLVLGFRVEHSSSHSRVPWNLNWAGPYPPAIAYRESQGAILEVHVRAGSDGDLRNAGFRMARALELPLPRFDGFTETTVGGEPAVSFTAELRERERPPHVHATVLERGGLCYALVAFSKREDRLPWLATDFARRFRLLPHAWFRKDAHPVAVDGPGWLLENGRVEHISVGARVPVGPGWVIHEGGDDFLGLPLASFTVLCLPLDISVRFRSLPMDGVAPEMWGPLAELDFDRRFMRLTEASGFQLAVGGRTLPFSWRQERGPPGSPKRFVLCGILPAEGRMVLMEATHSAVPDPRVPVALRDLAAGIEVLTPDQRRALSQDLAGRREVQFLVGRSGHVRNGVFVNADHRITWRKPSTLWSFTLDPGGRRGTEPLALLRDESGFTSATLRVFVPDTTDTKWSLHERVVDSVRGILGGTVTGKARASTLGSRDAVRTDLRSRVEGIPVRYTILTSNPIARKCYAVSLASRDEPGADEDMERALRGLKFQMEEIPRPGRTARGWDDPVFGYRVAVPAGPFTVEAPAGLTFPEGGTGIAVTAGDEKLVVAACRWAYLEAYLKEDAIERAVALLDREGVATGRFRNRNEVAGIVGDAPSSDRVYPGDPFVRVGTLRRNGILYVVAAAAPGREPAAASWFRFLD
jgi:hypothetical protein